MGATLDTSVFTQTYTSFSGIDIRAIFHQDLMVNIQGLSYSITREKAPIYSMGRPDPWSFSRGKRGIAGSAVFTVYDRAPLLTFQENSNYLAKQTETHIMGDQEPRQVSEYYDIAYAGVSIQKVAYADQIPPFDITLTAANEYGQLAIMRLYGVEFLNEGAGLSVDDIVNETQMTFICRYISGWKPVALAGSETAATGSALGSGLDVAMTEGVQYTPIPGATQDTSYVVGHQSLSWPDVSYIGGSGNVQH
ncbi:MAG: hypothetical protein ACTSWR_11520 [Candidatus Helarchaeota archaeon]